MADDTQAPGADSAMQSDIIARSASGAGPLSARDAARALTDTRAKDAARQRRDDAHEGSAFAKEAREAAPVHDGAERDGGPARESPQGEGETAAQESTPGEQPGTDTAQETGPGETQGDDQGSDKLPPIDPPRSWTKEDKELFRGLPRETQERLAERERSREADFLRRQNEASERLKGAAAREQEAAKARTQYEQALPLLLLQLQSQQQGDFAGIKTVDDVERLAREDWPRYVLWDAQQKKINAIQQQVAAVQAQQAQQQAARWHTFAKDQDARFFEKAPELADVKVLAEATQSATELLADLGFSEAELSRLWHGQDAISLRDHRMQLLLRDGVKYREAQAKAKAAQQRPVPNVQRPGPAPARNADADERVRNLDDRLTSSGNLRDAAALLVAQRQARARR